LTPQRPNPKRRTFVIPEIFEQSYHPGKENLRINGRCWRLAFGLTYDKAR